MIANTVKGKGVSFMENDVLWHYRFPHDGWEYDCAVSELYAVKPGGVKDPYTPNGHCKTRSSGTGRGYRNRSHNFCRMASDIYCEGGLDMRDTFVRTLITLAKNNPNIELFTGDLGFGVLKPFWEQLPDQFVNAGIAEQNMTAAAAGAAGREKLYSHIQ